MPFSGAGFSNALDFGLGGTPISRAGGAPLELAEDLHTDSITLTAGAVISTNGFRIYSRGPVSLAGASLIVNYGDNGHSGASDGQGGRLGARAGTLAGGFRGGDGANVVTDIDGVTGRDAAPLPGEAGIGTAQIGYFGNSAAIGTGGQGGPSPVNLPGVGGETTWDYIHLGAFLTPFFAHFGYVINFQGPMVPAGGAGGGGGGSDTGSRGGGGGQGGGVIYIAAPSISLTGGSVIGAKGGNGGDGVAAASSGGGGGQGGYINLHVGDVLLDSTSSLNVDGGTGGGGIDFGLDGSSGRVFVISEIHGVFTSVATVLGSVNPHLPPLPT